jgi:hypothetical protein
MEAMDNLGDQPAPVRSGMLLSLRRLGSRCGRRAAARVALALLAAGALGAAPALAQPARTVLGVTHVAGKYNFTSEDFLNEGADQLLALGTQVIKVWFTPEVAILYPFNSTWGSPPTNLVDLAQHPYFQALFAKRFTTYILVVESVVPAPQSLKDVPPAEIQAEQQQRYDLAKYLLTAYAGTGKTFILQNWEGDHLLRAGLPSGADPTPDRVLAMAEWWNAHQAGVAQARAEVRAHGVGVYNAIEVNALADAMAGKVTATNNVVPLTHADLYSYSSWDIGFDPEVLTQALDYLQSKAPPNALFGRRNIYLGEYGAAKDQLPEAASRPDVIRRLEEAALGWGVRYAVYWQLYDNEPLHALSGRPGDADMRGFWLIRPDGIKAQMWSDLQRQLPASLSRVALRTDSGQYLTAPGAGGGAVRSAPPPLGPWQVFTATVLDGQRLDGRDVIYLQAHNGMYVRADGSASAAMVTVNWDPDSSQLLILRKVSGDGPIANGDQVTLQTRSGRYLAFDRASGGVLANLSQPGPAATFRIELQN